MTALDPWLIRKHLNELDWADPIEIVCLEIVSSTNDHLKKCLAKQLSVCIAEHQTQGRGRLGRTWHSPKGGNLYASIKIMLPRPVHTLGALSLVTGLSLVRTLHSFDSFKGDTKLKLKWPNDLYYKNKKLAGILIEILETNERHTTLIIGIGLNLTHCPTTGCSQETTSMHLISGIPIDRNQLVAVLIVNLTQYLKTYTERDWTVFESEWRHLDYLYGKEITFKQSGKLLKGTVCGVDKNGRLQLESAEGMYNVSSVASEEE